MTISFLLPAQSNSQQTQQHDNTNIPPEKYSGAWIKQNNHNIVWIQANMQNPLGAAEKISIKGTKQKPAREGARGLDVKNQS